MADRDGTDQDEPKLTPEEAARILEEAELNLSKLEEAKVEPASPEESGQYSAPEQHEIDQATKEYAQAQQEVDVAEAAEQASESQLEQQFEQQAANPEHSSQLAEAHAEMSTNAPEPEPEPESPDPTQRIGPVEDVSPEELGNLSPMDKPEMQPEQSSVEAEAADPTQRIGPIEDVSPEELGNLSPMDKLEMQPEQNSIEDTQLQEIEQAAIEYAQGQQEAEAHTEVSADAPEPEAAAPEQDEVAVDNEQEYQPTPQDWAEYGEYLAEQDASHATQAEYSEEMNAVFDQYADQGNDEQSQELEEEPER